MKSGVKELYKLNPEILLSKKKCIFGTGMHAKQTYVDLSQQGIRVDYFVDRVIPERESSFMGIPVINEDELNEEVSVIIASTAWKDITERLYQRGITDIYVDLHRYGEVDVHKNYLCSVGKYTMNQKTLYILCPAGIGDTLYVAALAKAVKESYSEKPKVCLITKKSHACIGNFFEGVDEVIGSDQLTGQLDLYSIATGTWYLRNYVYGHFKKNLCQTFDSEYMENENLSILSYYKRMILKVPDESKLDSFHYEPEDMDKRQIAEIIGKNKRFVILMPYANTARMLPDELWKRIADFYINKGYAVYTNVKDETEQVIFGTLPVCENIYNMVGICSQAELVISVRNGMCDVLAMSRTSLIILDTDKNFYEKWNTGQISRNAVHIKAFEDELDVVFQKVITAFKQ